MNLFLPAGLAALTAVAVALVWWPAPSAAAEPPVTRPTSAPRIVAEGRVAARPGAQVQISSEITARLLMVPATEGQTVAAGTLLAQADDRTVRAQIAAAEAQRRGARAAAAEAQARQARLQRSATATSDQEREQAERDAAVGAAQVAALDAELDRLAVELDRHAIRAPIAGTIVLRRVSAGELATPGLPLFTLVDRTQLWVVAEIDEADADRVAVGQAVQASDGTRSWTGAVVEVPVDVVARGLEPSDPGRPLDAAVLRARIALDGEPPRLGQRLDLRLSTAR